MSLIQIRNVPADLHRTLKARAARSGLTLSDYLLRELSQAAQQPTLEELRERIRARRRPASRVDSAAAVRAEREGRR